MKLPDVCTVCKTKWTKTPKVMTNEYWVHCLICKKQAKQIVKELKEQINPHSTPDKYSGAKYVTEDWSHYDMYYSDDDF